MPKSTPTRVDQEESAPVSPVVKNLLALKGERMSVNAFAQKAGVNQTTMRRILIGEMDLSWSILERIASRLGVQAWQLAHPDGPASQVQGFSIEAQDVARRIDELRQRDPRRLARLLPFIQLAVIADMPAEPESRRGLVEVLVNLFRASLEQT